MKPTVTLSALLVTACLVEARPVGVWTYADLTDKADLVVIATPTSSQDTRERTTFPDMPGVAAVGVETKFEVLAVFKGDKEMKEFVLHHLRPVERGLAPNGPQPIAFDLKGKRKFLLFLRREEDGRFASVTGQTDAAVGVRDLGLYP